MSVVSEYTPEPLTGFRKFESKFNAPFCLSFDFGSTFSIKPSFGSDEIELFYFDWLWIHIVLQRRGRVNSNRPNFNLQKASNLILKDHL